MGKTLSFSEENVKKNPFDYPKLKLAKGEQARLTLIEDPTSAYVHSIQKPMLDEKNNVIYETKERKDGTEYQVPKRSFVSNPICLGDEETLDAQGNDPVNCPMCKLAVEGERTLFPKRRFAVHVIRTNTRPRSFDAVEPFGGQLIVWAFTDVIFNKLVTFQKEQGLKDHDVLIGPCTDETFQKADLAVAGGTTVSKADRAAIGDDKNKAEDIDVFLGNKKTLQRVQDDLAIVAAQWALSKGEDNAPSVTSARSLNEGLGALLDETKDEPDQKWFAEADKKKETAAPVESFDDLEVAAAPAKAKTNEINLEDLLD